MNFRNTVLVVCLLNLLYFGTEFYFAQVAGSVSLVADSIDFLEDALLNGLIFTASFLALKHQSRLGLILAALLLVPVAATLWALIDSLTTQDVPVPSLMTNVALGALAVNVCCAVLLARHRKESGSLSAAAYLSSRNDAAANIAIICAGLITQFVPSAWPDILVGIAIAMMNMDAAHTVYKKAQAENVTERGPAL
jgi:Co/Zn/Cd efflux system component